MPAPPSNTSLRACACTMLLPGGHAAREPDVAADDRAATDGDAPEDGGARIDDDVVLDDRVPWQSLDQCAALVDREPLCAEGDGLVESHALADDGRLADHDAGAVVDEEASADGGAGVDVDAVFANAELSATMRAMIGRSSL